MRVGEEARKEKRERNKKRKLSSVRDSVRMRHSDRDKIERPVLIVPVFGVSKCSKRSHS